MLTETEPVTHSPIPEQRMPAGEHEAFDLPPLPEGYEYSGEEDISDKQELADAMTKAGLFTDRPHGLTAEELARFDKELEYYGVGHRGIGVRDEGGALVGYALVMYKGNYAEFASLGVDPDHRGLGIGKALIDARLRFVEQENIKNIYMTKLAATNNLRSYYAEHGFRETPEGQVVRGQNPMPMTQAVMHIMRSRK